MNSAYTIALVTVLANTISCLGNPLYGTCVSPQYLEYGEVGTISCVFTKNVTGLLWYNTTDFVNYHPIVDYQKPDNQKPVKTGAGYDSGEFDVHPNGSLIINKVSLLHDTTFHVAGVTSGDGPQSIDDVTVIVFMKPLTDFPIINKCGNISNVCYSNVIQPLIHCSVHRARPSVTLTFKVRTVAGDRNISNDVLVTTDGQWYTSRVSTRNVFQYTHRLSLLVCQASSPPGVLQNNESQILVQNQSFDLRLEEQAERYFIDRNKTMKLSCADELAKWVVWKKAFLFEDTDHELLMYSLNTERHSAETYTTDATMGTNGSFILPLVDVKHEGLYYCIFGDGITDGVTAYNVSVVVRPVPAYPVIEVCQGKPFCKVEAKLTGNLTCTVKGIRPLVQLEWGTLNDTDAAFIFFGNKQQTNRDNGETFDVTLTATYSLQNVSIQRLVIECTVLRSNQVEFDLMAKLELSFEKALDDVADSFDSPRSPSELRWIIPVICIPLALTVCAIALIIRKYVDRQRKSKPKTSRRLEEEMPMVSGTHSKVEDLQHSESKTASSSEINLIDLERKRTSLKRELRQKYKDFYDAVQPIPDGKRYHSVNEIFVEGGIQCLKLLRGTREEWENLVSYADILNDFDYCNRIILEGGLGYGKSMITLQLAYDWCNFRTTSILKDIQILILLRLGQLGGFLSIYKSIKRSLLPDNSDIEERDLKDILENTESVVLILDGYEEYPHRDAKNSDIMKIFKRDMYPEIKVILTTRSSTNLPKIPPRTKRIRLTGFTEKAQEEYIRNVVVGDNNDAVENVKRRLQHNSIVSSVCGVPSLFVMFSHLIHEPGSALNLNSVKSILTNMISCMEARMRIKIADDAIVAKYKSYADDHNKLDEVAFKYLCGKYQQTVWMKEDLCKRLGKEFYDAYIQTGILIEEDIIMDAVNSPYSKPVKRNITVRFYQKIFCEWYAAHFLAKDASKYFEDTIKRQNGSDFEYVCNIACGINAPAADKIIQRLNQVDGGHILAVLCRMEIAGDFETIKGDIRQLCSEGIIISDHDSKLLQRSCIQLLEIAAKNGISIHYVNLYNSLRSVNPSTKDIETTSGLVLSPSIPLKKLIVACYNRKMGKDKFAHILEFCSMCQVLRVLRFYGSVPPRSFQDNNCLSLLESKSFKVYWKLSDEVPLFKLNLKTGIWEKEKENKIATSEHFKKLRSYFADDLEDWTPESGAQEVRKARKRHRKEADKRRKPKQKA